jgi:hypothetical protein
VSGMHLGTNSKFTLQNIKILVFTTEVEFTARYALSPSITQIRFVLKRLMTPATTKREAPAPQEEQKKAPSTVPTTLTLGSDLTQGL